MVRKEVKTGEKRDPTYVFQVGERLSKSMYHRDKDQCWSTAGGSWEERRRPGPASSRTRPANSLSFLGES